MRTAVAFELPPALEATAPPEARGLQRDEVRLMVAERAGGRIEHAQFRDLPWFLGPGDLLVVNTSATLPAALPAAREDGTESLLHVATQAPHMPGDQWWVVELREARHVQVGERVGVGGGASFEIAAPYAGGTRLWLARFHGFGFTTASSTPDAPRCRDPLSLTAKSIAQRECVSAPH